MVALRFIDFVFTWLMIVAGNIRTLWLEWRIDTPNRLRRRRERVRLRVMRREQRLQRLGW